MKIKKGDKVTFEIGNTRAQNRPRWEHNLDAGATGQWAIGDVKAVENSLIEVHYEIDGLLGRGVCFWHAEGHANYIASQWGRPGFLKLYEEAAPKKCECGTEKLFGPDASGHSYWCPKSEG